MGNCLRKRSAVECGGEDWGSFGSAAETRRAGENPHGEAAGEKGDEAIESGGVLSYSSSYASVEGTEVKIKISKKQLEQLLKTAEVEGLSAQQVLAELMNSGDQFKAHRRSWKPALLSIPE